MNIKYFYKNNDNKHIKTIDVMLENKKVGKIVKVMILCTDSFRVGWGFQYFPKGHNRGGEIFTTLEELKKSLEA